MSSSLPRPLSTFLGGAALLLFASVAFPQDAATAPSLTVPDAPATDPAISADALSQHVHALASDAMKGRMTGAPETRAAAEYIAGVLAASGVQPAGDDGTWFQRVPLVRVRYAAEPTLLVERKDGTQWTAKQGSDFRLRVQGTPDAARRLAVAAVDAAPDAGSLGETALFVPGRRTASREALDALIADRGRGPGLVVLEGSSRPGRERPMRGGSLVPVAPQNPADQILANARLLEELESGAVAALTLQANAVLEDRSCQNVIGLLPPRSEPLAPEHARQAIVVTAHYDHIGHDEEAPDPDAPEGVDTINNGADDDASGVAAVLELAEALAAGPAPTRPILFLLVTGEERGLLGTDVYLDQPVFPLEETLYNLNIEMIGRPDPLMPGPGALWLTGWAETTLGPSLEGEGQPVQADPRPEQNFYQRSDNIAFVRRGVMGQTLSSFGMHTDYHQVSDEADTLDYDHMETATRNVLKVLQALALEGLEVEWGAQASGR